MLKSATVQKIDNLTRFGRIYLVARSQIADTYAHDAQKQADHDAAIDKFEVLLKTAKRTPTGEPEELNLDENTIVIYTSDQGLCGGHHGMWGMGDHSRPLHTFEEAI